jgi:hypothetical protein
MLGVLRRYFLSSNTTGGLGCRPRLKEGLMTAVSTRTLQVRLLILVLLAFIPAIGFFWYASNELRDLQLEAKEKELLQRAQVVADEYGNLLAQHRILLATIAEFPEVRSGRNPGCHQYLERVSRNARGLTTVSLIGMDGYLSCGTEMPESGLYLGDRLYFLRASSRRDFSVGEFTLGRLSGLPVVGVAIPLIEEDEVRGVLASSLNLNILAERVSANPLPPGYTLTILDREKRVLVRLPRTGDFTLADSVGAQAGSDFPSLPESRAPVLAAGMDMDGLPRLFALAALRGSVGEPQGYVAYGRTQATLMQEVEAVVDRELQFLTVGAVALLALAWILGHFWVARIPEA